MNHAPRGRSPARHVRACFVLHWCTVPKVALEAPHFTLHFISASSHVNSSHLLVSLSNFFSTIFMSGSSKRFISWKLFSNHLSCSRLQARAVREKSLAQRTVAHRKFLNTETWKTDAFTQENLFVLQSLHHSTSQYYFVLQNLHQELPSTTLDYRACTRNSSALCCPTRLPQSTSQY